MHPKQRKILCIVGGALAVGGIAYAILRQRSKTETSDTDNVEFSAKVQNEENAVHIEVDSEPQAAVGIPSEPSKTDAQVRVFENIGACIHLPPAWKIAEDISPVPNVAMISISNSNYSQGDSASQMPGSSPVLVLSVEDNALEGLDLEEFKEKSKQTAMQQMYMMTNGMVPPRILFDGPQENGVFEMVLEYALETPMFQMRVINFITMRDDLAYVIQFMGNAEVFAAEIESVREIVRDFEIVPIPYSGPASQARVSSAELGYTIDVPVNWIIESRDAEDVAGSSRILSMTTATPVKTERIELLKSAEGAFNEASLRAIAGSDKATNIAFFSAENSDAKAPRARKYSPFGSKQISVMEYLNVAGHQVALFSSCEFCLRVTPLRCQSSIIKPDVLLAVMSSITPDATESIARYVNYRNGFSFPIKERSRVVESRIGDNTVTLAPEGIQAEFLESINSMKPSEQSFEATPIFTIRCGDPSTDKDCEKTLEKWMERLRVEKSRGDVKMAELQYDDVSSLRCISFTQKEMQETSPGKKDEHQAKIFVLVEGGKTFMLRWETPTEVWRKFEPKLHRFLDGFSIEGNQ